MPASETQKQRAALLTVVFWMGIGLAPLAAALVLFANGSTGLRLAGVLAILATVLIGLAVMLRPDAVTVRAEIEELVFEELDVVRDDVREDIATAARATHKAFSEKLQQLYETVEMLREQVEAARAQGFVPAGKPTPPPVRPNPSPSVGTAMVGGGVVRHTETVQVTTRQTIVDPHADDRSGTVYGGSGTVYGARPAAPAGRRSAEDGPGQWASAPDGPNQWAPTTDRPGHWEPQEESWTEKRLRERRAAEAPEPAARTGGRDESRAAGRDEFRAGGREEYRSGGREEFRLDPGRRPRPFDRDESGPDDAGDDPRWTDLRAGDRWASVRSDDRGRELRMGERRAAVHSDGTGTELRIEDRWAQVRREDARGRGAGADRREPEPDISASWSESGWTDRRGSAPALPAPPPEPASAWTESWRDDREPVRRRRASERDDRDDRWEREDASSRTEPWEREGSRAESWEREQSGSRSVRPRLPEFEPSDERWR